MLLMEKILHQLVDSLSRYLQGFIHPRWCRISSINSSIGVSGHSSHWKLRRTTSLVHSWQTKTWLSLGKPPFSIGNTFPVRPKTIKSKPPASVNHKPFTFKAMVFAGKKRPRKKNESKGDFQRNLSKGANFPASQTCRGGGDVPKLPRNGNP